MERNCYNNKGRHPYMERNRNSNKGGHRYMKRNHDNNKVGHRSMKRNRYNKGGHRCHENELRQYAIKKFFKAIIFVAKSKSPVSSL